MCQTLLSAVRAHWKLLLFQVLPDSGRSSTHLQLVSHPYPVPMNGSKQKEVRGVVVEKPYPFRGYDSNSALCFGFNHLRKGINEVVPSLASAFPVLNLVLDDAGKKVDCLRFKQFHFEKAANFGPHHAKGHGKFL